MQLAEHGSAASRGCGGGNASSAIHLIGLGRGKEAHYKTISVYI